MMFNFGILAVEECFHVDGSDHYWIIFKEAMQCTEKSEKIDELCTEWLLENADEEVVKFVESRGPVRQVLA